MKRHLVYMWFKVAVAWGLLSTAVQAEVLDAGLPASEPYPTEVLETLRACMGTPSRFSSRPSALDHIEAWFLEFRRPIFYRVLTELRLSPDAKFNETLKRVEGTVRQVRQLADFRTEQALIAVLDAAMRGSAGESACREATSVMLLRVATQCDRAWVWAEAMDRSLDMSRKRQMTMREAQGVAESLREIERSSQELRQYKR